MLKANLDVVAPDPWIRVLDVNIEAALSKLWRAYLVRRNRLQTIATLSALSDRTLKDIGISRAEIYRLAESGRTPTRSIQRGA